MKWKEWMPVIILIGCFLAIKWLAGNSIWVLQFYTQGLYPWVALTLRTLLGWIPISIGDLLYATFILWMIWQSYRLIKQRKRWLQDRIFLYQKMKKISLLILLPYVLFNLMWGLNYNRPAVMKQFHLHTDSITQEDMRILMQHIIHKLNHLEAAARKEKNTDKIFEEAISAYQTWGQQHVDLPYKIPSVKSSLFGGLGNYLGYAGYYNPFTGEAQVNTAILPVQLPFTTSHEIAHQLGYAKENEANIIGFLAARNAKNAYFKYGLYFDVYAYCRPYMRYMDSTQLKQLDAQLHPSIQKEYKDVRKFYEQFNNPIEVVIDQLYGQFLKANQQPEGKMSYNRMILWMVAYYKKYGIEAI